MTLSRRVVFACGVGLLASAILSGQALASDYKGTIKVLVGWPAGGATDTVARVIADKLKDELGQPVVVDNRGGAGGMIATQQLKAAAPDGSTVMLTMDHTHVIIPLTYKNPGYDPITDFTPIAGVASYHTAMAVSASLGVRNFAEFRQLANTDPSKIAFGVPAPGSIPQFASFVVGKSFGIQSPVVAPYKGGAPLLADLLGGQVAAGTSALPEYIDHHRSGKLSIVAVSGSNRSKFAPDVPTFQELGLKGVDANNWAGFIGPKGLPKEFIVRFGNAVEKVLKNPAIVERLEKLGNEPIYSNSDQLAGIIKAGLSNWRPVIKNSGYELQ